MSWEIYTTGGGYNLFNVFNMLAAYVGSGNFIVLIQIGIIVGVIWAAVNMAMGGGIASSLKYVIVSVFVMTLTLGPKSRVVIVDQTQGTIPIYGVVDNVPTPVAMLGHYTSAVSYYVTRQMETLLSTPTDLTYQRNGILFGSTLLAQAANWNAVSPRIHELMVNFMQNCAVDAANLGHMDLEMVATSGNLETFLAGNLPNSLAYYDVVAGETRSCRDGWTDVRNAVTREVNAVLTQKAASLYGSGTGTGAANVARLTSTLGAFQTMMGMNAASAVQTIKQAMYVNAMDDSVMRFIANSGNSAAMDVYQAARAEVQTRSSYAATGANAAKFGPLLKIVIETLYYAAFPLAVFMMMTPLAATVFKGYCSGFVWLASWEPLSAILHSVVIWSAQGDYRRAGVVTSDGSVSDVVLSWANHFGIRAVEQDISVVAGYMMSLVPFLAAGIMFGANRMAGLATSMMNVSQGAAIETGREVATGNHSLGNLSMNNYAGNKMNMSGVWDTGRFSATLDDGGIVTQNPDGSSSWASGTALSSGGASAMASSAVRSEISQRAESSRVAAESAAGELSNFIQRGSNALTSFAESVTSGKMGNDQVSWEGSAQQKTDVSTSWQRIQDFAKEQNISTQVAMEAGLAGNLGAGVGVGVKAGISANIGTSGQGISQERWNEVLRAAEQSNITSDVSRINSARNSMSATSTDGTQISASEGKSFSLDEGERMARSYITRLEEAQNYSAAQSRMESAGASVDVQLNQMVAGEMVNRGKNPLEVSEIMNPKTPEQAAASKEVFDSVVDKFVDGFVGAAPSDPTQGRTIDQDRDSFRQAPAREATMDSGTVINLDAERERIGNSIAETRDAARQDQADIDDIRLQTTADEVAARDGALGEVRDNAPQSIPGAMWGRVERMLNIDEGDRAALQQANPEVWSSPGAALDYYGENPQRFQEVLGRPFVDGDELGSSPENRNAALHPTLMQAMPMTLEDRDVMIRTVLGEAANEGAAGQAAVALVIRNRADDERFPDTVGEVSRQPRQFSAWNGDGSGNSLVSKYGPGDPAYEKAGYVVDAVMGGFVPDFTEGSTHYYAPAGMRALVDQGYQKNLIPGWMARETEARDTPPVQIGGHIFTGQVQGRS
ncbi:conjugal transfer protein TraG N-terminal domain-containing protein [Methylobacterium sp.]|uniref:conjugal transfer protein TraG N-terminal domain-containing protein n=1 Tax=Methylobacterium sp. TaxID=409 RepID=UPI003C753143